MGKENIEKYSPFYALLKLFAGMWHNTFFYRKVIVLGKENINTNDHLIFAPNHQNALMDALAVLFTQSGQPVFLARADIFKKKFIASILYFLKILPVYRIRDGFDSLKSNDWIFNKTIDVIRNKNGLVILPEGNHEGTRRLRQLKKGICRIAFQAEEASGFNLNMKIIPVGLEFTHYSRVRQVLTVVYGKPIEVNEFREQYQANPQVAMNSLKDRLSERMRNIMVHIDSEADYEALDELRSIINGKYSDDIRLPKLFRDRMLIDKLNRLKEKSEETYRKICELSLKIKSSSARLGVDYRLLSKKRHTIAAMVSGALLLLVALPVFLYGLALNFIFLLVPALKIKNLKDKHFISSIRFGISVLLAMLFLPLYLVICLVAIKPLWLGFLIFLTIPAAGLFAWSYYRFFLRIKGGFRVIRMKMGKDKKWINLSNNYNELTKLIANL